MLTFFYNIFISFYIAAIRLLSIWNYKARLWWAGRRNFPVFNFDKSTDKKTIWMHCASLGEFEQGRPLIESIKKQYPHYTIVLTFFSPSGYEAQKNYAGADAIFSLPMDSKQHAAKFIEAINPGLVLWIKYDYWFFYLQELKRQNIPVLLVSAIFRNSQPFFKWYGGFFKKMLPFFTHFFVQDEASKVLLHSIGINKNITVSGDTRFDRVIEIAGKFEDVPHVKQYCGDSKVIVAGSTWEDDETELTHYVRANPQIKFIIAPHETDAENLKDVQKEFPGSIYYSALANGVQPASNVLIVDNIGMLARLYHYADITYVGGGFGQDGVHNVLEAAVYGKPVIFGPEFEKFAEAVALVNCGGGISIDNALELEKVLATLWNDEAALKAAGQAAKDYVYANGGASKKIMSFIQENRLLIS